MQEVRNILKWADGKAVKNEFDIQVFYLLGPKTADDMTPALKQAKQPKEKKTKSSEVIKEGELQIINI